MVKVRFNALDVAASVNALRLALRGMRLNNIYDIDNKVKPLCRVVFSHDRFLTCFSSDVPAQVLKARGQVFPGHRERGASAPVDVFAREE